ncbi:hypothetical protein PS627_03372 [Pseudomonas fluorescens]|uniref:DUF2382 domain-containing protein n=1 Tax=Pseudomonas fluorescens TaxID=294 RepID=UPI00125B2BBD|nr:DUF2382 domain-containing protein [Pseudomonas fluorescens]CAG8869219.1 hypothetical protein PS627_03372 [Pseudomonas fluorescens]VVP71956.1 hypothetical protein PS910_00951 [Pseudomonas fluorescens]
MDNFNTPPGDEPIPVLEEVATVVKRTVTTGVTTVEKQVHSQDYVVSESLQTHSASVERVPIGTEVDASNPPQVRTENGLTIIPVLEEILVVEKRLVLKEELHIRQHVEEAPSAQAVTLRSESVVLRHREVRAADRTENTPDLHDQPFPLSNEREIPMTHTLVAAFDTLAEAQTAKTQLLAQRVQESDIQLSSSELHASGAGAAVHTEPHDDSFMHKVSHFFGSLFGSDDDDSNKPHRYATAYPEAYRRGAAVLTVTAATEVQAELVEEILERNGAIDIDERVAAWGNEETGSMHVAGTHLGADRAEVVDRRTDDLTGRTAIPVIEENLRVGKRELNTGRVRVVSRISERPVEETVNLHEEHAHIERRPVDRAATPGELNSFKEGSIEIQETAEEVVVEKSARVVEEVTVGKQSSDHKETVRDTVRRTDVDVQSEPGSVTDHETLVKNPNDPLKNR